ncbi:MAG: pyrroloquinoline quinone biosynthesis protein PqqB, partial [Flammeovirgaceae bacterium]|nr:pyrroloquinoline quinone biosynthesis protein PqqB [Flammeovirgaceae bacterium]
MRIFFALLFAYWRKESLSQTPYLIVLGFAQDAGYPHIGCEKSCCEPAWRDKTLKQSVVSLALVDPASEQWWLFEAA